MTMERFWIVGGDYSCMGFECLKQGTETVVGPFGSREEAQTEWRRISEENRTRATARYAIASEQLVRPH